MRGMVSCPEPLAADAGAEVLRRGGNAADAAVAAAFVQGVVNPLMCGIGGVATIIAHTARTGRTLSIRAKGVAGSQARPDLYLADVLGDPAAAIGATARIRGDRNCMGYESVMVPGFVRGVAELAVWCGSGRLGWPDLLEPATRLAVDGFEVYPYVERPRCALPRRKPARASTFAMGAPTERANGCYRRSTLAHWSGWPPQGRTTFTKGRSRRRSRRTLPRMAGSSYQKIYVDTAR
jgi:gamma-glutamyltranspeptidase